MPLPEPGEKEPESAFVSRCMGNEVMNTEFTERAQRYAVCQSQWRRKKGGEKPATGAHK